MILLHMHCSLEMTEKVEYTMVLHHMPCILHDMHSLRAYKQIQEVDYLSRPMISS